MDLNPLDPRTPHHSAGARRRDEGAGGFRGLMDLMSHVAAEPSRPEDDRRTMATRAEGGRARESSARRSSVTSQSAEADPAQHAAEPQTRRNRRASEPEEAASPLPAPPAAAASPATSADVPASAPRTAEGADAALPDASGPAPAPIGSPAAAVAGTQATAGAVPVPAAPPAAVAPVAAAPVAATPVAAAPVAAAPIPAAPIPATPIPATAGVAAPAASTPDGAATTPDAAPASTTQAGTTQAGATQAATTPDPARSPGGQDGFAGAQITVEQAATGARTHAVAAAVLVQAHMAANADAAAKSPAAGGQSPLGLAGAVQQDGVQTGPTPSGTNPAMPAPAASSQAGTNLAGTSQTGTSQTGTSQTGTSQTATGQVGAAQSGAGQSASAPGNAPLHVGGGQDLFVGADAGGSQDGGDAGGESGGQQGGGQQGGGQAQAGSGFAFGAATIGQRGFGGDAARAQFQEILATRTARAPLQGSGGPGSTAGGAQSTTAFTAGPGGPQSTLSTAMASRAEATAQGRPGATPGTAVGQVALKLTSTAADGGGRVTIRLNPEELGKVDVKLELGRDGLVRATISAERPETLDLLQRDSRMLEKALQDAGLKTDQQSLAFDLRGGSGQAADRDQGSLASRERAPGDDENSGEPDSTDATAVAPGGVRADGSYDLVA